MEVSSPISGITDETAMTHYAPKYLDHDYLEARPQHLSSLSSILILMQAIQFNPIDVTNLLDIYAPQNPRLMCDYYSLLRLIFVVLDCLITDFIRGLRFVFFEASIDRKELSR